MHELHSKLSDEGRNTVTCPLGTMLMLGLAANGSDKNTRREILRVLGVSRDHDVEPINSLVDKVQEGLTKLGRIRMGTMLCRDTRGEFTRRADMVADTIYRSTLAAMDYSKPNSAASFNGWARHATEGKITHLMDEVDPESSLMILNASYMSAGWKTNFRRVGQMGFKYGNSGLPLAAEFLEGDHVELKDGPAWDFLKISYEQGSRTSMIVIRPKDGNLKQMYRDWDLEDFLYPAMPTTQAGRAVSLLIPRFKVSSVHDERMRLAMVESGLTDAVVPGVADFSELVDGYDDAYLTRTVQAAAINVDAAARGFEHDSRSDFARRRYVLDSPFLAIIMDEPHMLPLYMVSVNNPNLV